MALTRRALFTAAGSALAAATVGLPAAAPPLGDEPPGPSPGPPSADDIADWTRRANEMARELFVNDRAMPAPQRKIVLGTWPPPGHRCIDLRGEDPDRAMLAWVEPIERLARQPAPPSATAPC